MKTIAFILERFGNGGAERVTASLAKSLAHISDYNIHVLTYVKEENEYLLPPNVTRHVLGNGEMQVGVEGVIKKILYLKLEIAKIKPDFVVSLATPKTNILLSAVSMHRKYKLVLSERNDPNQYPSGKVLKLLRNRTYRMADGVVFQTPDAKAYFDGIISTPCVVIQNPISDKLVDAYNGERKKKIVSFCRIEPQKNIKMLIDAFIIVSSKYTDYTLEIYGTGDLLPEMKEYVTNSLVSNKVTFYGFQKNVHERIRDAAMFVSSSNYEGISNSMIEALALGLPCICTDCPIGGARMMIESGKNGILIPVGDVGALAKAMEYMICNNQDAKQMGLRAREIRSLYSADAIANRWIEFLREL